MASYSIHGERMSNSQIEALSETLFNLRLASHTPILFYVDGKITGTETPDNLVLPTEMEQPLLCDSGIAVWLHANAQDFPSIQEETSSIYYCTCKYENSATCIIGPLSSNRLSKTELHGYMRLHHMHNYYNYYMRIASHKEALALMSVVNHLIYGIRQPTISYERSIPQDTVPETTDETKGLSDYLLQNYRLNTEQHIPYMYEQELLDCLRKGDYERFEKKFINEAPPAYYSFGKVAHNELKQFEYMSVGQIMLFGRAAIEGGVNPYDAYDISDMLLQELSSKHTIENYEKVQRKCIQEYFAAVKKAQSVAASSFHIEKCKYYISKHLRTPFTIPDIADYVGLTPKYLGELFHQYEPCTLKQYIIKERLNAAKNMLKYSDQTIAAIADSLCFQSQSYFGALFKKETGMSPARYRNLNKPQNF